jgi:hypothetical protein
MGKFEASVEFGYFADELIGIYYSGFTLRRGKRQCTETVIHKVGTGHLTGRPPRGRL